MVRCFELHYVQTHKPQVLRVATLGTIVCAIDLVLNAGNAATRVEVGATGALDINIFDGDVRAYSWARALQVTDKRIVFLAGGTLEVLDGDIGDSELGGKLQMVLDGVPRSFETVTVGTYLIAQRDVLLTIALSDLNSIVDIGQNHAVISDVLDSATATSSLEVT